MAKVYHGQEAVKKAMQHWGIREVDPVAEHIIMEEGFTEGLYDDTASPPVLTAGVGQTRENIGQDFFRETLPKYEQRAKRLVPSFYRHPMEVRKAIMSAVYRGDIPPDSNTAKALDEGDYKKAATEFLDHKEYRKRKRKNPDDGVVRRMERIAETFYEQAMQQQGGRP